MSWSRAKLGDAITLKRGHDLPSSQRKEGVIPVVSSSGITGYHGEAKAAGPGVVTGRYGTLGEVYYVESDYWPLNTSLYVCDFKGNSPRFVAYLLRNLLRNFQSEKAAVPGVNRNALHQLEIWVPCVSLQQEIEGVLSCYDDLIENNHRRIQLLEESARLLYKEWFVHLRFPGHEHVNVTNGMPEGWSRKKVGDIAQLHYGKALKKDARKPGPYPVYGSSGVVGEHDKPYAAGPAIIVGRKGNVGSVYWSSINFYPIDTVYFIEKESSSAFLYYALRNIEFISTDVAVPGLNRNFAHSREILVPDDKLRMIFEEYAQDILAQVTKLGIQSASLAKARDLLLPKLMSGELAA